MTDQHEQQVLGAYLCPALGPASASAATSTAQALPQGGPS